MYKVIEVFDDLQDIDETGKMHRYEKGDAYPRDGVKPSTERILELSSDRNRRGKPLIAPVQRRRKKKEA